MPAWRYELDGQSWLFEDLTLEELRDIEKALDIRWGELYPSGAHAGHLMAILGQFLLRDRAADVVEERLRSLTRRDVDAIVHLVKDDELPTMFEDGVPKEAAGLATT